MSTGDDVDIAVSSGDRLQLEDNDYVEFNCLTSVPPMTTVEDARLNARLNDSDVVVVWRKHLMHHANDFYNVSLCRGLAYRLYRVSLSPRR